MDDLIPLFVKIGLSEQKAKDTAKNKKLAPTLETVINEANVRDGCDKDVGILLYTLATAAAKAPVEQLPFITKKIMNGDLKTTDQITGKLPGNVCVYPIMLILCIGLHSCHQVFRERIQGRGFRCCYWRW